MNIIEKGDEPFDMLHMPVDGKGRRYAGFWVLCQFETPDHVTHIFASRGRFGVPKKDFVGDDIKVYVRGQSFKEYFDNISNRTAFDNLLEQLEIEVPEAANDSNQISGKTFVITGSVNHYTNRNELKEEIE